MEKLQMSAAKRQRLVARKEAALKLKKYAGAHVWALVTRMGGMYKDIHALAAYVITPTGHLKHAWEEMPIVANKRQRAYLAANYKNYISGRPTPEMVVEEENILHDLRNWQKR